MSSKEPKKGSTGDAQTSKTAQPAPEHGERTVKASMAAFTAGQQTSTGGSTSTSGGTTSGTGTGGAGTTTGSPTTPDAGQSGTSYTARVSVTNRVLSELQNIGTFPALGSAQQSGGGGGGAQAPLQRTVEQALQSVLGRLPRSGDYKSFVAALNMSFTYTETSGGRGQYQWTPRTYIGRTDLGGGVTGAQASLVTFAQSAYDNSLPLLDHLEPLAPETDEEEVQASLAIVRSLWTEFVNELGKEGGPRAARADSLSATLLGDAGSPTNAANCQLTRLGMLLGMVKTNPATGAALIDNRGRPVISRRLVVTAEEETNLTNFVSMSDYMYSAQAAWKNYLQNFFQKDLGTGLVLLSRLFSVLAETVDEVYAAMDSVYIGPAERLTIRVGVPGKDLSVEELLSWVHTFATEEAPLLIQDGGRRGVEAIVPTATLLRQLIAQFFVNVRREAEERVRKDNDFDEFLEDMLKSGQEQQARVSMLPAPQTTPQALPVGMTQPRVLNPLKDVYRYLDELVRTASEITA